MTDGPRTSPHGHADESAINITLRLADDLIAVLPSALTGLDAADVRSVYLAMLWAAHRRRRLAQAWGARVR